MTATCPEYRAGTRAVQGGQEGSQDELSASYDRLICLIGYIRLMTPAAWAALAEPRRREILEVLRDGPRPVGELVEQTGLSQPGTSKHLRVLREAGLVRVQRDAQRRVYALEPAPLAELDAWLAPYRRMWKESFDALERHLDSKE